MEGSANHHRGGAGEPLLLLHAFGLSWRAWRPLLAALEARHDVLALDLPGFGGAPPLPAGVAPSVAALADAVERELDRAGFERPWAAGNSLGGWIAIELARRGRARGVVALSPAGKWTARELAYLRALLAAVRGVARVLRPHAGALAGTAAGRVALLGIASGRPWQVDPLVAREAIEAYATAEGFGATLDHAITGRAERLDEVHAPVVVAWGTRDVLLPPRQAERYARAIPGAELRMLPRCGHIPMWGEPALVAGTILGFTERRPRAAAPG